MAWRDWFSRKTPLELAIERGLHDGGSLANEIERLDDYVVRSRQDAEAICSALRTLLTSVAPRSARFPISADLFALTRLFQKVGGAQCDAFDVLAVDGTELLIQAVDAGLACPGLFEENDLLFALRILATYGTAAGTDAVIRAARHPLKPDGYLWSPVLGSYSADHPERERLFDALMERWPSDYFALLVLEAATELRLGGAEFPHPFDTAEGKRQLERWLTNSDEDQHGYAMSAAVALAFVSPGDRDRLLAIAMDHVHASVQMEAAWAAGKLRREGGIKVLSRYCLDVNRCDQAKRYLTELERADAIPAEASAPDFAAKAKFSQWLAHPNELGHAPDELEIIDHRVLAWPPKGERIPLWLIKYRVHATFALEEDDEDAGLVGSVTVCLFGCRIDQRPPEDGYAIHCAWEMELKGLITTARVEELIGEYDRMFGQWQGEPLEEPRIVEVIELSPELRYAQRLVAVATARLARETGWVVLDGPRSTWYSAAQMPAGGSAFTVAKIHIGRVLLGFHGEPDRARFLKPGAPELAPQTLIDAYEGLLKKALATAPKEQEKLLSYGPIRQHWERYVAAAQSVSGDPRPACVARCYEKVLHAAINAHQAIRKDVLDSHSAAGMHFPLYVDALLELDRKADVAPLVELFRPFWRHNMGYARLGTAAFKAGEDALAEEFFVILRKSMTNGSFAEDIGMLAQIWHRRGDNAEARDLLLESLSQLVAESKAAEGTDRDRHQEWFQAQRNVFLRLFPTDGESELKRLGIPDSTP